MYHAGWWCTPRVMRKASAASVLLLILLLAGCSGGVKASSSEIESAMRDALGVRSSFSELYAADPTLWGGYVSGVRTEGSNIYVTLQVGRDDPARDQLGQMAARALSTLLPADVLEGADWIVVEDASRTVIAQQSV